MPEGGLNSKVGELSTVCLNVFAGNIHALPALPDNLQISISSLVSTWIAVPVII
jgi:hypothetical protein